MRPYASCVFKKHMTKRNQKGKHGPQENALLAQQNMKETDAVNYQLTYMDRWHKQSERIKNFLNAEKQISEPACPIDCSIFLSFHFLTHIFVSKCATILRPLHNCKVYTYLNAYI